MDKHVKDFLYEILTTPSPTGYEQPAQRVVRRYMEQYADLIEGDVHGNLIVGVNTGAKRRVMLAGHCDQIGFLVRHITKEGFIYVGALGGIDVGVTYGSHVTIHAKKGPVAGVIGQKPIHARTGEEREKQKLDIEKIWIDIGAKDKQAAERRVEIGDPITYRLGVTELTADLIASPGLDDKAGLFVAMETLRLCATGKKAPAVALYAVSTVQEEAGLRGARTSAYGIDPEIGIAIDVTHASDNPGNENTKAVTINVGGGPAIHRGPNVNPVIEGMLFAAAKKNRIAHQALPDPKLLGNDANAMQVSRAGVAAGSVAIPNRYMHTQVEVCSLKDMENAAKLLAAFVRSIGLKTDFRPC